MTFGNEGEALVALTTGRATPEDLREIVTAYPQLRTTVAAYPATYPALLDWLADLNDPAIGRVLAERSTIDLQNPGIDATTLHQLAAAHPELLPAILEHPNCYPELATWISQQQTRVSATASSPTGELDAPDGTTKQATASVSTNQPKNQDSPGDAQPTEAPLGADRTPGEQYGKADPESPAGYERRTIGMKWVGAAVAVFVLCSIIQAMGDSDMFSTSYYEPDSPILDLLMNLTFFPGWFATVAFAFKGISTLLGPDPEVRSSHHG